MYVIYRILHFISYNTDSAVSILSSDIWWSDIERNPNDVNRERGSFERPKERGASGLIQTRPLTL